MGAVGVRGGFDSAGHPDPSPLSPPPYPNCSDLDKWSQSLWGLGISVWHKHTHKHRNTHTLGSARSTFLCPTKEAA